jgi:hypothetical protein
MRSVFLASRRANVIGARRTLLGDRAAASGVQALRREHIMSA